MLSALTAITVPAMAGGTARDEYTVKAVYLLNFGKFTKWPQTSFIDQKQAIILGIFGEDVFGDTLDIIIDQKIEGRKLVIKKLGKGGDPRGCNILFISASEKRRLKQILSLLANQPVLTVSDMNGFAEEGGIVGLKKEKGKIKIVINHQAAKKAGLILRSQLLDIATIVSKED